MEQHACNTTQCFLDQNGENQDWTTEQDVLANVTPWTVGLGAMATLLLVSTALGNALVCVAITREKRLQNTTNYFLMSLAVNDFMVALFGMPFGILKLVTGIFPLSRVLCIVSFNMNILLCNCSILHLCTLSVDRYLSLRYPLTYGRNKTRRRVVLKISLLWIFSALSSEPVVFLGTLDNPNLLKGRVCTIRTDYCVVVIMSSFLLVYLLLMMIFHALTIRHLKKVEATKSLGAVDNTADKNRRLNSSPRNTIVNVESPMKGKVIEADATDVSTVSTDVKNSESIVSNMGRHQESEKRASKVLNIIFFTFFVLWAPYLLLIIIISVCEPCVQTIPYRAFDGALWFGYTSSTVNPVIYTIFNPTFRETFTKILNMRIT